MRQHPTSLATLASQSAPWLLPVVGLGLFLHKHFLADDGSSNPCNAMQKARCRQQGAKIQRRVRRSRSAGASRQAHRLLEDHGRQLADAVLGNDAVMELYTEDQVDLFHSSAAQANPAVMLDLLQQYGTRLVVDSMEDDSDGEDSMWLSDDEDPQHQDWQQQGSHHHQQQQLQQEQQQAPGQEFLRQLAAATTAQQQQQQEGTHQPGSRPASAASDDEAAGSYFDDSYFGLPADASAAPHDLQELQAVVSKNLEALLPRDTTWAGSYPPRFDELLSPAGPDDQGGRFLEPDPEFDFDAFDYVPDFDFDPEFDPEFEEDMLDFDIEP